MYLNIYGHVHLYFFQNRLLESSSYSQPYIYTYIYVAWVWNHIRGRRIVGAGCTVIVFILIIFAVLPHFRSPLSPTVNIPLSLRLYRVNRDLSPGINIPLSLSYHAIRFCRCVGTSLYYSGCRFVSYAYHITARSPLLPPPSPATNIPLSPTTILNHIFGLSCHLFLCR